MSARRAEGGSRARLDGARARSREWGLCWRELREAGVVGAPGARSVWGGGEQHEHGHARGAGAADAAGGGAVQRAGRGRRGWRLTGGRRVRGNGAREGGGDDGNMEEAVRRGGVDEVAAAVAGGDADGTVSGRQHGDGVRSASPRSRRNRQRGGEVSAGRGRGGERQRGGEGVARTMLVSGVGAVRRRRV